MNSNTTMIKKLQTAININYGYRILYTTSQFYSKEQNRPITMYHIKRAIYDDTTGRYKNVELFKSASQIRVVLFLRDLHNKLKESK